jgi:ethanolamine ammonia-lyase small subunit
MATPVLIDCDPAVSVGSGLSTSPDFILIDGERPELSPSHSLTSALVYSASATSSTASSATVV